MQIDISSMLIYLMKVNEFSSSKLLAILDKVAIEKRTPPAPLTLPVVSLTK